MVRLLFCLAREAVRVVPAVAIRRRTLTPALLGSALVCLLAAGALCVPSGASAHHAARAANDGRFPGQPDVERIGKELHVFDPATRSYRVYRTPGAPPMVTHVDPVALLGGHIALPSNEDAPVCATSGHRIKLVYSGTSAGNSTAYTAIRTIAKRMNWKVKNESVRSSGSYRSAEMRVDCESGGQMKVYDVPSASNDHNDIRSAVESALGLPTGSGAVKYLVFRDAGNPPCCSGIGWGYVGLPPSPDSQWSVKSTSDSSGGNYNRIVTTTAIVWHGTPDYWWTHVTLHELVHVMGGAQYPAISPAPFASPGAHCVDGLDVLCYADGSSGGYGSYGETRCPANGFYDTPSGVPLDCGYDTYFDAKTEDAEWLASWWNVGECENPFLVSSNGPNIYFNAGPSLGTRATSFTASLSGTLNPDCDQITYRINWGDGAITNGVSGSHTYATTGTKTITGTVTDQWGNGASDTMTVQVCDVVVGNECRMASGPEGSSKAPQRPGGSR